MKDMQDRLPVETISEMQKELFDRNGSGWFRIVSGSMRPLIRVDDRIYAVKCSGDAVEIGDIVLFQTAGELVTHRVVGIDHDQKRRVIYQKGDASWIAAPIVMNSVWGKVTAIEKAGKVYALSGGWIGFLNRLLVWKNCRLHPIFEFWKDCKQYLKTKEPVSALLPAYRAVRCRIEVLWGITRYEK